MHQVVLEERRCGYKAIAFTFIEAKITCYGQRSCVVWRCFESVHCIGMLEAREFADNFQKKSTRRSYLVSLALEIAVIWHKQFLVVYGRRLNK
jgi:hypothetical protein